jgi:hypothetical protein
MKKLRSQFDECHFIGLGYPVTPLNLNSFVPFMLKSSFSGMTLIEVPVKRKREVKRRDIHRRFSLQQTIILVKIILSECCSKNLRLG